MLAAAKLNPDTPPTPAPACRAFLVPVGCLILLFAWHGWMVLSLFGPLPVSAAWQRLLSDEPIVTGKHPANLYLGTITARALSATGSGCCYDPANDGGCPVTPIHSGSRLAQVFLLAAGTGYQPAAYKVGLALTCLLTPLLLLVAGRGFGLTWSATAMAATAALVLWWGQPQHHALREGEVEIWLGAMALLAHTGLLIRFHCAPGVGCWLGLVATAGLGCFAQPLLMPFFAILGLAYYFSVGAKHRMLLWHVALLANGVAALAINAFWLRDWLTFWWLRAPCDGASCLLPHRTLRTLWEAPLWGGALDRAAAVGLLASGFAGIWMLHRGKQRPAARMLAVGGGTMLLLAFLGVSCEALGQVGHLGLLLPALWFAAFPAAHAWTRVLCFGRSRIGGLGTCVLGLVAAAGVGWFVQPALAQLWTRLSIAEPLAIGLGREEKSIVDRLILYTGPEARILWESRPGEMSHWTALLTLLTGRSYIGALDPVHTIQHAKIGLVGDKLNDLPLSSMSDLELEQYCRLYNVGWIVAWSPATGKRLANWSSAKLVAKVSEAGNGWLFAVQPHLPTFTLKGQAQLVHADAHHITLADVVPEDGVIVLSLHYQSGMRALPSRVVIEREPNVLSKLDFMRLRVAGPVSRVTLTWDER
ncbi:MAG: hypothetical protein FJ271_05975 [Planctomycetes bacterium]|nr:hypothetical protein [Planctomycetota bacterium]